MKRFAETIFRPRKQHRTSHNPSASDQPPQETTGGPTLPNPRPRLETGRTGPFLESTPSVSLATVLCSSCRNIFSGDPDRFQSWDSQMKLWKNHQLEHHRTALSFADALSQQCYICTRAHKALRSEYLETPLELLPSFNSNAFSAYEVHIAHLVHKKDDKVRSEATITILQPSFKHGNEIRIVAYSSKEYDMDFCLPTHTSSIQCLDLAKKWLGTCDCGYFRTPGWTPTRLLDIGTSNSRTWRLCIPSEGNVRIRDYVTLSYRWGNKPFIKLAADKLRAFRSGKPISVLPRTFQDAIAVARHFGIRYLWVDALCIIQDSEDDIARECSAMSTIYTNSACNLAATSSDDPFGGLFRKRNYQGASIGNIRPVWTNLASKYWPLGSIDSIISADYFGNEIRNSSLRRRGWILQETALAPKVLHFGENQLYWECSCTEKCETFPHEVLGRLSFSGSRLLLPPFSKWTAQGAFRQWRKIMEIYSRCGLSKPSDKLTALSGLAQHFQKGTGDVYLAGLWKSQLPRTLHWEIYRPEGSGKRAQPYRAPTWTWASLDGPIWNPLPSDSHESVLIEIVDSMVETGLDPTGAVSGGKLIIRAPAQISVPIHDEISQPGFVFCNPRVHVSVSWDEVDSVSCDVEHCLVVTTVDASCVDFLQKERHKLYGNSRWSIHGIVLISSGEAEQFLRAGAFSLFFSRTRGQSTLSPELALFGLQIVDEYGTVAVRDASVLRRFEVV